MKKFFMLFIFTLLTLVLVACDLGNGGEEPDNGGENGDDNGDVTIININVSTDAMGAFITVTPDGDIETDEIVTIETTVPQHMTFEHWYNIDTQEIFSTDNPTSFTATQDLNLTAVFDIDKKTLAEEALARFNNDFTHMDEVFERLENSNAMEMLMQMGMTMDTPEGISSIQFDITQRIVESSPIITETIIEVSFDNMPDTPSDQVRLHFIIKESENFFEAYMDAGFFLDMLMEEDDFDARTILGFDSDWIHLILPNEFRDDLEALLYKEFEEALEDDLDFEDELLEDILEHIENFMDRYDLNYLLNLAHLDISASIVDEEAILTEVSLGPDPMKILFEDFFEAFYNIALLIEEDELPPFDEFKGSEDYNAVLNNIDDLEPFTFSLRHVPGVSDAVEINLHFLDFLKQFEPEMDLSEIHQMTMQMSMKDGASITDVTDAKKATAIGEELLSIFILEDTLWLLEDIDDLGLSPDDYVLEDLIDDYDLRFSPPVVDKALSLVTVTSDDILIQLYYDYNEKAVFNEAVSLSYLEGLGIDQEPTTREELLTMIAAVDKNNINIYAILLRVIEESLEEIPYETIDPTVPPYYQNLPLHRNIPIPWDAHLDYVFYTEYDEIRYYEVYDWLDQLYDFVYYPAFMDAHDFNVLAHDMMFDHFEQEYYVYFKVEQQGTIYEIELTDWYPVDMMIRIEDYMPGSLLPMPSSDYGSYDDFAFIDRYEDSILFGAYDGDPKDVRAYLSQDNLDYIYNEYVRAFSDDTEWFVYFAYRTDQYAHFSVYNYDSGREIMIRAQHSNRYEDAVEIVYVILY